MPVFTQTITQQNISSSAGIATYPGIKECISGTIIKEQFNRNVLNPGGSVVFYSSGGTGSPSISIPYNSLLDLQTGSVLNNDASVFTNNINFSRITYYIDSKSSLTWDFVFFPNDIVNTKFFIGVILSSSSILTDLPSASMNFMGLELDTSVDNNLKLVSSNGTSITTTDTGKAVARDFYRLNITWTGNDSGVITLYNGVPSYPISSTVLKQVNVTSFLNGNDPIKSVGINFYNRTLENASKQLYIYEWSCSCI